jgi:hypothetical protein
MITAIEIENFKGIGQRQRIELRPITLLFGPNSAGKSTILHAMHYAREVLDRHNLDADRTISGGEFVDLGGFRAFVHNHNLDLPIKLAFEMRRTDGGPLFGQVGQWQAYETEEGAVAERLANNANTCAVEITVSWSHWLKRPFVAGYAVSVDEQPLVRIEAAPDKAGAKLAGLNLKHPIFGASDENEEDGRDDEASHVEAIWRAGLLENTKDESSRVIPLDQPDALPGFGDEELRIPYDELWRRGLDSVDGLGPMTLLARINLLSWMVVGPGRRLRQELERFRYLGPLRRTPPRDYQPPRFPDPSRWACGLGAWDRLVEQGPEFAEEVNKWLVGREEMDCGYRVNVISVAELPSDNPLSAALRTGGGADLENSAELMSRLPTRACATLTKEAGGIELLPHDIGVGLSQVIPVIVTALDRDVSFASVEQPELHLHPKGQAALGDVFIAGALAPGGPRNQMIIETHSEHLILRLVRRIRETTRGQPFHGTPVAPGDLGVCYVYSDVGETTVIVMEINAQGEFLRPWPDTFFSQDFFERTA